MPSPSKSLNIVLAELLAKHDGIVIGEGHGFPGLRQSLTYLMPQLKALGVETLTVELTQKTVDEMIAAPSVKSWLDSRVSDIYSMIPEHYYPGEYARLLRAAHHYGIKVVGHEDAQLLKEQDEESQRRVDAFLGQHKPDLLEKLKELHEAYDRRQVTVSQYTEYWDRHNALFQEAYRQDADFIWQHTEFYPENDIPITVDGMRARNVAAAAIIQREERPDGKTLVLSGFSHTNHDFTKYRAPKNQPDSGLDTLLGFPVVMMDKQGIERNPALSEIGITTPINATGTVYEALLPKDIRETFRKLNITSWPPDRVILPPQPKQAKKVRDFIPF